MQIIHKIFIHFCLASVFVFSSSIGKSQNEKYYEDLKNRNTASQFGATNAINLVPNNSFKRSKGFNAYYNDPKPIQNSIINRGDLAQVVEFGQEIDDWRVGIGAQAVSETGGEIMIYVIVENLKATPRFLVGYGGDVSIEVIAADSKGNVKRVIEPYSQRMARWMTISSVWINAQSFEVFQFQGYLVPDQSPLNDYTVTAKVLIPNGTALERVAGVARQLGEQNKAEVYSGNFLFGDAGFKQGDMSKKIFGESHGRYTRIIQFTGERVPSDMNEVSVVNLAVKNDAVRQDSVAVASEKPSAAMGNSQSANTIVLLLCFGTLVALFFWYSSRVRKSS